MFSKLPTYFGLFCSLLCQFQVQSCTQPTFEGTRITALKNLVLNGEVRDYNFFSKFKGDNVAPIWHITGCLAPIDELEDVVAIQIRDEEVPIFYEGAVNNLPLLHSLHVESCEVNILKPKAFQNLPSLTVIKLIGNHIDSIPADVFNNLMIRKLILSLNNISYINRQAFNDMPNLEGVNLDSNKLKNWNTDWFINCPKIQYLSVKFNQLTVLPARAFRHLQDTLQRLYLSENNITSVSPRTYAGLRELTDLSLSKNNITELDDTTFLYLEKLKVIDLSETNISCFSDTLLNTLRRDVLLCINNIPLKSTCKLTLEEWAKDNENELTFYKTLKNETETNLN